MHTQYTRNLTIPIPYPTYKRKRAVATRKGGKNKEWNRTCGTQRSHAVHVDHLSNKIAIYLFGWCSAPATHILEGGPHHQHHPRTDFIWLTLRLSDSSRAIHVLFAPSFTQMWRINSFSFEKKEKEQGTIFPCFLVRFLYFVLFAHFPIFYLWRNWNLRYKKRYWERVYYDYWAIKEHKRKECIYLCSLPIKS